MLFVVISCLNSSFIDPSNLKNLLRQVSINALISFGMTFVILTGGIDLSVGSILALSSALMGSFIKGGMDPVFGIVLACLIGAALGSVNGLVITYGKVAPFIATLATMTIFRGLTWYIPTATLSAACLRMTASLNSARDMLPVCRFLPL